MVFYRKYRPQTIEELDSKSVRDALTAILSSKDVSHAFLFTGPKGLGKTSTARIVAKVVNCEQLAGGMSHVARSKKGKPVSYAPQATSQIEPCNKCYQCISITNGANVDVLEIDGASNRGIDEIRDLREKVRLSPASALKKVYIIDEVHMLTTEAFNALLKTLEEPPNHVIFILCTTEPHKVPATIISRCNHIIFKKATIDELVRSFKRIAGIEKLKIDDETLQFIATLSDGSFRDGAKILEEMKLTAGGGKITKELVGQKYQISNIKYQILEMIEFLSEKNTADGIRLVSKLVEQGVDMKYFLEQLIAKLHEMLLVKLGVIENSELRIQNSEFNTEEIKRLVELLTRAYGELKYAVLPQLPLEMMIVEWGLVKGVLGSPRRLNDSSEPSGNTQPADKNESSYTATSLTNAGSGRTVKSVFRAEAPSATGTNSIWQELIDKVKVYNHSVAGVLRGCTLKSYDKDKIVIEAGFRFHKERLDEKKTMAIIEKTCKEIMRNNVSVSVLLKKK